MAILDLVSIVTRPAGRLVEGQVRDLVHQIIRDQELATVADLRALRRELETASQRQATLQERVQQAEQAVGQVRQQLAEAAERARVAEAALEAATARIQALEAVPEPQPVPVVEPPPVVEPVVAPEVVAEPEQAPEVHAGSEAPTSEGVDPRPARGSCRIAGCQGTHRSKGFCSPHYQQWRRGTLPGFVTPEGHAKDGKRTFQVDPGLAGQPFTVSGKATERKIRVAGAEVEATLVV